MRTKTLERDRLAPRPWLPLTIYQRNLAMIDPAEALNSSDVPICKDDDKASICGEHAAIQKL